jgi:hypothetical protein
MKLERESERIISYVVFVGTIHPFLGTVFLGCSPNVDADIII